MNDYFGDGFSWFKVVFIGLGFIITMAIFGFLIEVIL
tara:strand:+ start:343 stop:453 length:111 start_codon:yes stop_codon:yes gene_type:complete